MVRTFALAFIVAQSAGVAPFDVSTITLAPAALVCELDLDQLKGELRRVSWSPDGRNIHVQTAEPGVAQHDYIITVEDGVISLAFGEPEWGAAYWRMKSDLAAPGIPSLRIEVQQDNRRTRPTAFSGGTANGGAYTPNVKDPVDAFESEVTLRLLGVDIGSWVNHVPLAGETFGWGPWGSGAIVYVGRGDRLTLMDQGKHRTTVGTMKDVAMPAWSSDGARLAFVQKSGKKRYRLMTAAVRRATISG
jgi:hypothetical protein